MNTNTAARIFTDATTTTIADTGIGSTVADSGALLATAANQHVAAGRFVKKPLAATRFGGQ
jgi:hypothetical protein